MSLERDAGERDGVHDSRLHGTEHARALARLNLVGESPLFRATIELICQLASWDATVLIQGETGTGKELAARALHYLGSRSSGPFVPVNCAAIPDSLVESEFFGHVRGAFTDARDAREGLIAQADGGTLFLDEIETLSLKGQGVLLRFLQDKQYRPVGGKAMRPVRVRVLAASNLDLGALVAQRAFRSDVLFRLGVLTLDLPPLRARTGDALLLAQRFVERMNAEHGGTPKHLDPASEPFIAHYGWPGNVRELENLVYRQWILGRDTLVRLCAPQGAMAADPSGRCYREAKAQVLAAFEREYVASTLARANGSITEAAKLAGKERSAFGKLAKKHDLRPGPR